MGFGDLVNGINVWPISEGDFAAVGVADELADDALEDAFLVGHQGGLERGQIADLAAVGQFHGVFDRDFGKFDFLGERGSIRLDRKFYDMAILTALAPHRVVEF